MQKVDAVDEFLCSFKKYIIGIYNSQLGREIWRSQCTLQKYLSKLPNQNELKLPYIQITDLTK